jgi:hypothetical protein
MNEQDVLAYNPFDGDFGSPGDRILKDKMVTARKPRPCDHCGQEIQPNERIRVRAEIVDGSLMSWKWCQLCCEAMASNWSDNGAVLDARSALRR